MGPKNVDEYVHWVLEQDNENAALDPEVRKQLESDYVQALEKQINAAIVGAMPEKDLPTFEQIVESGTKAEIQEFCEQKVPGMSELIAGVLVRFKIDYLGA